MANFIERRTFEKELEDFYIEETRKHMATAFYASNKVEYKNALKMIRELEATRSKNAFCKKQQENELLKIPTELAKTIIPLIAWIAVSKWAIKVDTDGVFHSSIVRSIVNSKPRLF